MRQLLLHLRVVLVDSTFVSEDDPGHEGWGGVIRGTLMEIFTDFDVMLSLLNGLQAGPKFGRDTPHVRFRR